MAVSEELPHASDVSSRLINIELTKLEAETRCPVCLGIIKECRLVSGCMHRFCADCIEKWLRIASEPSCPQCRVPMQSRRDCKKDPRYDRLLAVLYANIYSYEEKVYEPRPEVLADAHKTGHALMIAAAAQRAKRASQRRAPGARGAHAAADGRPYALFAPSSAVAKVAPVLPEGEPDISEAGPSRTPSPLPRHMGFPQPSADRPSAGAERAATPGAAGPSKGAFQQAKRSAPGKRGAAAKRQRTEPLERSEAKKTDESTNEADAIAQAHALAQQAAAAAQAEADQCKPVLQVHLHRESSMDFMLKEADIVMVCSPNMTLRQVTKVLQQRHACLQGRTLFFRISNTLKAGAVDHPDSETSLAVMSASLADCRDDLHLEFVASRGMGQKCSRGAS